MKKNTLLIFILIFLSLPSIIPLFHPGFFQSDDGEWMVIRFSAFHQALVDGQFPVRFLSRLNHEYGYPVANFLYPGFMYLAEIPKVLGFGFVDSIKIVLGLSMISSVIFAYLWLSKIFDKMSSFFASLFYLYIPYHLFDLYKRGSIGEVLALAILPFILWQIERKSLFWAALGTAFLIISHNTLALLFLPIVVLYMLLNVFIVKDRKRPICRYTGILVISLGLSAFFWIPAIYDLQYTVFSKTPISNFSRYFANLELIGLSTIFIFLLVFVLFLAKKIKISKHRLTLLLFIVGLISLFFSTQISYPFWNLLPVSFIQFPFRFLSVTILSVSFLTASLISTLSKRLKIFSGLVILLLVFISTRPFMSPSVYVSRPEGFYTTNMGTTTVQNEYLPKWVKVLPRERASEKVKILTGQGKIKNSQIKNSWAEIELEMKSEGILRLERIYFPGWKAFVDEKETRISYENEMGLMEVKVPKGKPWVKFVFGETPLRLTADFISLAGLIGLVVLTVRNNRLNLLQIYQYIFSKWGIRGKR